MDVSWEAVVTVLAWGNEGPSQEMAVGMDRRWLSEAVHSKMNQQDVGDSLNTVKGGREIAIYLKVAKLE